MSSSFRSTKAWAEWWANRKIDWVQSYMNWDHPHRYMISAALGTFQWGSLFEVGMGAGANLVNILKHHKGKQLGGCDVAPEAIETAKKHFNDAMLRIGPVNDILLSDDSTDVVLSDMCLIYVGWKDIDNAIEEMKRVGRLRLVLCEFHHNSLWKRLWLKYKTGYNAYDYVKLLERHGMYDIQKYKIPEAYWPGGEPQKTFGYLLIAKIPKRK